VALYGPKQVAPYDRNSQSLQDTVTEMRFGLY